MIVVYDITVVVEEAAAAPFLPHDNLVIETSSSKPNLTNSNSFFHKTLFLFYTARQYLSLPNVSRR